MTDWVVIKRNILGEEVWRWKAKLLKAEPDMVVIEARFNRPDLPFHGMLLAQGDKFIEAYFPGRWYNVFEVRDGRDDSLKGWYCAISPRRRKSVMG